MMSRNEVKLMILFLAFAANSGCFRDEYGAPAPDRCYGEEYARYESKLYSCLDSEAKGQCGNINCCGEWYEWDNPKLMSCLDSEAKDQCDAAICCNAVYPSGDSFDEDDLDNYLACIKEAADNGCPGQTLYGPPSDQ